MAKITTITNPLTGQPVQVDQLEHTAQQIDDAIVRALPGGAIDTALQNKVAIDLLWENASPDSSFVGGTVEISNIANYDGGVVEFKDNGGGEKANATSFVFSKNFSVVAVGFNVYARIRAITITSSGVSFGTAFKYPNNVETQDDSRLVPVKIYGIKGVTSNV